MKRSEMLQFLEIVLTAPRLEWDAKLVASEILDGLEKKGMLPPAVNADPEEVFPRHRWEPEEGHYTLCPEDYDNLYAHIFDDETPRNFEIISNGRSTRAMEMAQMYINGSSYEEIATLFVVTRERVRQVVAKYYRKWQKARGGKI